MVEEHDQLQNVEIQSNFDMEANDEENHSDEDFLGHKDFSGFDNEEIPLNLYLDHDNLGPSSTFFDNFYFNDNEVAHTATESRGADDVLKAMPPTSRVMVESSRHKDAILEMLPSDLAIPSFVPSSNVLTQTQTFLPPVKRRRLDPSQGVLIQDQAPPAPSTVVTTTITTPHDEGPNNTVETSGLSAIP